MNKNSLSKIWEVLQNTHPIPVDVDRQMTRYSWLMRRLLFNRGISSSEEALYYLSRVGSLHDPFLMASMDTAVARLGFAIEKHEKIVIYGDYDVDGVTGTVLMVEALRKFGADVTGYIPNRFDEGYGLNVDAVEQIAREGANVIVTVDCGIRSPREADRAQELGVDLIISDHHEPEDEIPKAIAILCPKRPGDNYPEKNLAGVGIAFKIVEALFMRNPLQEIEANHWLDLVAIGTVADIVPLIGENRTLVKAGIQRLQNSDRQGIVSLAGAANLDLSGLTARDIGFVLGPRLNAAGRMESALASFNLLVETDFLKAGSLAQKLDDQNRQRQEMTLRMQEQAENKLAEQAGNLIFVVSPDFNMGIVGLVASRLTEAYYRPSIVGALVDGLVRASCRSIPEFHITRALDECSDLMERHGGHSMAAGFTIRDDKLQDLIDKMQGIAHRELADRDLLPTIIADLEIPLSDLHPSMLDEILQIEPCGSENRGVTFVSRNLKVTKYSLVGKDRQHLRLSVKDGSYTRGTAVTYDAIAFRMGHWAERMPDYVDLLYVYEKNSFNGRETMQLNVRDIKPSVG